jgi:hypothetical protein
LDRDKNGELKKGEKGSKNPGAKLSWVETGIFGENRVK